ncbi:branched-chain amino acid ABC transporter permease [Thermoproteota archaeon]
MLKKVGLKEIFMVSLIIFLFIIPFMGLSDYLITVFILAYIFAIVAASWDIINGWSGVFNFAQIAFFAVGAYASGTLSKYLNVSPVLTIWVGGLFAVLAAVGIGIPTLRLRGAYIALLTFAYHSFIQSILVSPSLTKYTGGAYGIVVPDLAIGNWEFNLTAYYIITLSILIIAALSLFAIVKSPIGIAFQASRDSFDYSLSRGISDIKYRIYAFIVGSFFTGVAGALYGHYNGFVDTTVFGFEFTWKTLAMLTVGGLGTLTGPIVSSILITFLLEWLRFLGPWRFFILGVLLWGVVVFTRRGLQQLIDLFFRTLDNIEKRILGDR